MRAQLHRQNQDPVIFPSLTDALCEVRGMIWFSIDLEFAPDQWVEVINREESKRLFR